MVLCRPQEVSVKRAQQPAGLSRRLQYPDDERRHAWLPLLLDAYALGDTGVAVAVRNAEKKERKTLACRQGCDVCCRQTDIPLYPHELIGLTWFVLEKLDSSVQAVVGAQLAGHGPGSPCPFLVQGACSVHPLRPLSCRQFNVFSAPCAPGEDPYYTRRSDVLVPIPEYGDRAFAAVIPLYPEINRTDRDSALRRIRSRIVNLQTFSWQKLADRIAALQS
jgi:Fe-S-cluster containining protein